MGSPSQSLKRLIRAALPAAAQNRLRRWYVARQTVRGRGEDGPEMEVVRSLVRAGDIAVDIGANVGLYTRALSELVGSQGQVLAFEPVAENFEILSDVVRLAGLGNVRAERCAVGAASGQIDLVVPVEEGFSGFYLAHIAEAGEDGLRQSVPLRPLDGIVRTEGLTRLDFVKCDVEGAEPEVLRGAGDVLKTLRPAWYMEIARRNSVEVFRCFHDAGYRGFVYAAGFKPTSSYRDHEFSNYYFFHPDSTFWTRLERRVRPA